MDQGVLCARVAQSSWRLYLRSSMGRRGPDVTKLGIWDSLPSSAALVSCVGGPTHELGIKAWGAAMVSKLIWW